ncbi:hypothetical protein LJR084_008108 [Variovorax sp. LjRoot84]|uniref:hypothetical protein n=1 Tax=Variovorax sp. LjRoot84 TaxID=3342340 RepID=UPI003ECEE2D7
MSSLPCVVGKARQAAAIANRALPTLYRTNPRELSGAAEIEGGNIWWLCMG